MSSNNYDSQQPQQEQIQSSLQPLFDSSVSLPQDDATAKADSARVLTPPSSLHQAHLATTLPTLSPNQQEQAHANAAVFGRLPANNGSGARARLDGHGRTASYGTSLLDTLNEEKQMHSQLLGTGHSSINQRSQNLGHTRSVTGNGNIFASQDQQQQQQPASSVFGHQRHFTLAATSATNIFQSPSPFSLMTQHSTGENMLSSAISGSSLSPPNAPANSSNMDSANMPTNASGILGAHSRLSSLSGLGPSSVTSAVTTAASGSSLLTSSALRSSYSSNSLRSAFARRSSPSPLGNTASDRDMAKGSGPRAFDITTSLDESVWGPSGLSNELDLLATPDGTQMSLSDALNGLTMDSGSTSQLQAVAHSRNSSLISSDAYARIRSYSFNSPPDAIECPDEADIDVLHAAAKTPNPSLAFRKMMARTHARSKTLASPFANNNDGEIDPTANLQPHRHSIQHTQHMRPTAAGAGVPSGVVGHRRSVAGSIGGTYPSSSSSHSKQSSDGVAGIEAAAPATVHIGIGGESVRPLGGAATAATAAGAVPSATDPNIVAAGVTGNTQPAATLAPSGIPSASHSRQPSMHTRQLSADFDFSMASSGDSVPTRSLWVGNVDPGLSSQDLIAIFGKYGRVESLRLLPDKECAFVNFLRVEDAIRAKEDMHSGARIGNNTVRVGYGKGESYATGDAQAMQPTRALWIGNIAPSSTPESLSAVFQPYGTIESARVLNHKNCGFVNFVRLEDAVRAKQAMNGKSVEGSVVRIGYAKVPAAKNESSLKMRNPVPSAAPLTVSGQIAEADAISGTTQRGLGNDMVLEPGFTIAIDEDLVAFPYATHLPVLPEPAVSIRTDSDSTPPPQPSSSSSTKSNERNLLVLHQSRLRDIRKQLESVSSPIPKEEFDSIVAELMPHVVDLCTDYVGNVLIQKIAERGDAKQKLELARCVGPHMASIGVHKNGTWAVQKIIDTADTLEQRRAIVDSIRKYTPQLLVDQLGNYVVQCCLRFGPPKSMLPNDLDDAEEGPHSDDAAGSNQFVFDAVHARCLEIAQGRFGARAIRTCLESPHATKLQQKLVAVALVTNAVSLATNANGHLLMNWLLESSKFTGRFRVLAHQLAPHLRYLATHKLGASTVSKLVDQSAEPDARDLILNTLFFNPDPTVLDDVLIDQAQGVHIILKVLLGGSIGDAEKARIADRLRFIAADSSGKGSRHSSVSPAAAAAGDVYVSCFAYHYGSSSVNNNGSNRSSAASSSMPPTQRLADVVGSILAHQQPTYPTVVMPIPLSSSSSAAVSSAANNNNTSSASLNQQQQQSEEMPQAQHYQMAGGAAVPLGTAAMPHQQYPLGFHFAQQQQQLQPMMYPGMPMATTNGDGGVAAMSFPANIVAGTTGAAASSVPPLLPPAGFGGMVGSQQQQQASLIAAYYRQQQQQQHAVGAAQQPPAGFFGGAGGGIDFAQPQQMGGVRNSSNPSAMPFYPYASSMEVYAPTVDNSTSNTASSGGVLSHQHYHQDMMVSSEETQQSSQPQKSDTSNSTSL
ncbi:hypothetical protein GGI25_005887 [Coemansia spiralis]|uniref:Uncharacterized protein n=1 Tax=Coemansia spiralis TaxID=417178 RepID=A0A9W8KVU2_9FUNG|nr:hypothetical protein GGI25_005887 [Coemansia spiralis]